MALTVGLATAALALVGLGARATYGARVSADEPQYLLTAISLAEDLDLDISDEIAAERYRPFHEVDLDPQTTVLDASGQQLSPHDPLLPILLAGPMAVAGWAGAKVFLALVAGATAAATAHLAVARYRVPTGPAAAVSVACFASPPLTLYATQVYPEMPAALCTVMALGGVTGAWTRRWSWAAVAGLVALPWMGVKYLPVATVLGAAWAVRALAGWKRAPGRSATHLVQALALVAAAVLYLVIHRRVYGGWTVYAAGDHFVGGELDVVGTAPNHLGRSRRLIGLLVDRGFGLAAWNPLWLALPAALATLARRRPPGWPVLVATLTAGWSTATWVALTMHGWWWPGRQVVVVLPLAVVALAYAAGWASPRVRGALVVAAALGASTWWWLAWEASTGRRALIVDFEQTAAPWYRLWRHALPDHRRMAAFDQGLTALWLVVLVAVAVATWRAVAPDMAGDGDGDRAEPEAPPATGSARQPVPSASPSASERSG